MMMEGVPRRGFARLLARLDDATRVRICGDELDDKLRDVATQVGLCAQAMAHARQVDEATKSLIANAAPAVALRSEAVAQHLDELQQLRKKMKRALLTLVQGVQAVEMPPTRVEASVVKTEAKNEEEDVTHEQTAMLEKLCSILTEQQGSNWLSEALETARAIVRGLTADESPSGEARSEYTPAEQQIVDVFKLLRRAVLRNHSSHTEDVATFRKILKRLVKKLPVFKGFVERCDEMLNDKQLKAAKKSVEPTPSPSTKSKKRRLSATGEATAFSVQIKSAPHENTSTAATDIRSKALLCSIKANALGDVFSLGSYDACLKLMIAVVNALTPESMPPDTTLVSTTLSVLVAAVDKIKVLDKRQDRLVCLESLLTVLVTKERLRWESHATKKAAQDLLASCRASIETLRHHAITAASSSNRPTPPAVKPTKKKKEKAAPSHKRFDDDD